MIDVKLPIGLWVPTYEELELIREYMKAVEL